MIAHQAAPHLVLAACHVTANEIRAERADAYLPARALAAAVIDRLGDARVRHAVAVQELAQARLGGYRATGSGRLEVAAAATRRALWRTTWRTTP